mgnify:CR=1 FL=1
MQEPVVRGDASWISVGDSPILVEPGGVGATPDKYAFFNKIDHGLWVAGKQTSPHGKHFHELFFKGKYLNGRIVFMFAPVSKDKRIWISYKPKNQKMKSEKATEILKNKKWIE